MEEVAQRRIRALASHLRDLSEYGQFEEEKTALKQEMATIETERARASFDVEQMTNMLNGGKHKTDLKKEIYEIIERDPLLNDGLKRYDLSREEAREECTKKFFRMGQILKGKDTEYAHTFQGIMEQFDASTGMRYFVQQALWIGTLTASGTPEQQKKWLDGAEELKIIGCFGMTELGYSSFLRGSETIATFDEKTDEFIINSTSILATKFWIGLAGQIATHCIAFANLMINGSYCGLQLFIVPLRDPQTGLAMPGISVGDLGAKYGRNGLDNGWIQFSHVRIPRENMLAKWAQVSRNGIFTPALNPALVYGSTITERVSSVVGACGTVDQAITIAIRYGVIRRQGPGNPQVMDFQSYQDRLMPHLATTYAVHFTYNRISSVYFKMQESLKEGNLEGYLKPLGDVHNTSCVLKAFCTWWGTEALEMCRRSLGGHGYSAYSSLPRLIGDYGVMTTGGGDNIVLAQQTAKYLLQSLQKAIRGKSPSGESVQYIASFLNTDAKFEGKTVEDLLDINSHLRSFQFVAVFALKGVAMRMQVDVDGGKPPKEAWNNCMNDLLETTKLHSQVYVLSSFVEAIATVKDEPTRKILTTLCNLHALRTVQNCIGNFLESRYYTLEHISLIKSVVVELVQKTRYECIPLVDALNIPDFVLNSPLGRYDGDIYQKYLEAVQNSRNGVGKAPYWDKLVLPHVKDQSQSGATLCKKCGKSGCDCSTNTCKNSCCKQ